ncbi:unnamed protein product, partial [Ectocarpus fasciculatus]
RADGVADPRDQRCAPFLVHVHRQRAVRHRGGGGDADVVAAGGTTAPATAPPALAFFQLTLDLALASLLPLLGVGIPTKPETEQGGQETDLLLGLRQEDLEALAHHLRGLIPHRAPQGVH